MSFFHSFENERKKFHCQTFNFFQEKQIFFNSFICHVVPKLGFLCDFFFLILTSLFQFNLFKKKKKFHCYSIFIIFNCNLGKISKLATSLSVTSAWNKFFFYSPVKVEKFLFFLKKENNF